MSPAAHPATTTTAKDVRATHTFLLSSPAAAAAAARSQTTLPPTPPSSPSRAWLPLQPPGSVTAVKVAAWQLLPPLLQLVAESVAGALVQLLLLATVAAAGRSVQLLLLLVVRAGQSCASLPAGCRGGAHGAAAAEAGCPVAEGAGLVQALCQASNASNNLRSIRGNLQHTTHTQHH